MKRLSNDWKNRCLLFPTIGNVLVVLALFVGSAEGALERASKQTQADLESVRKELTAQRERIAGERAKLSMRHDALQAEVRDLRTQWRDRQRAVTQQEAERATRRRRAEAVDAEFRSVMSILAEFRRASETRMNAPQLQRHKELLDELDEALASDVESGAQLHALSPALKLARALMADDLPPRPFPGYALDEQGRVHDGHFVRIGPIAYFTDHAQETAGYVMMDARGSEPLLFTGMRDRDRRTIGAWFDDGSVSIPVDASGGALLKLASARVSLWGRMVQGGVVMIPLLLIGVVCAAIVVMRYTALRRMEVDVDPALSRILDQLRAGDEPGARQVAAQMIFPWRDVLVDAVDHCRADRAYLEEILQDRIVMQGPRVSQYLGALAICAAAAPLLGLLGTVTGMIHTFQLITVFGTGDARSLSGGISEALITTQFGLVIAVPALLAHAYLARRAKGVMTGLEQAAIRFVRHVAREQDAA